MTRDSIKSAISDLESFLKTECNDDNVLNSFTLIKNTLASLFNSRLNYNIYNVPDIIALTHDAKTGNPNNNNTLPSMIDNIRNFVNNIASSSIFSQTCTNLLNCKLKTGDDDVNASDDKKIFINTSSFNRKAINVVYETNGWTIGKSRRNVPIDEENLDFYMKQLGCNWHLDIIGLSNLPTILHDGPLFSMGKYLLQPVGDKIHPTFNSLSLPVLRDLQDIYLRNPYHNALHGTLVGHMSVVLYKAICSEPRFTNYEEFGYILAALGHDAGHPGKTNAFLSSTGNPLALIYNDNSILENYHSSLIFHIMRLHVQFFNLIPPKEWEKLRKRMIQLVLSTDMSNHFTHIDNIKNRRLSGEFDIKNDDDFWLLLVLCIKTADIGHNFLPWVDHITWTHVLFEEFYLQGDEERFLSMPLLLFFDRTRAADIPNSQLGFFKGFTGVC